jgi:hypothetical protein
VSTSAKVFNLSPSIVVYQDFSFHSTMYQIFFKYEVVFSASTVALVHSFGHNFVGQFALFS